MHLSLIYENNIPSRANQNETILVVSDTQICARHHLWVFINSWVPGYAGAWAHARALSHPCSSSVVSSFSSKILVQLKHSIQKFCLASSAQNLNQDSTKSQAEKMTPRITLGGKEILRGQRVSKETRKLDTFKAENIRNCPPNLFFGVTADKKRC